MYREWTPPPRLAESVECFWTSRIDRDTPGRRVLPDGCVDLLFCDGPRAASAVPGQISVVGTMTTAQVFDAHAGTRFVAVRLRPAAAAAMLGLPGCETTDRTEPWSGGGAVNERLHNAPSDAERVAVLASALPSPPPSGVVQRLAMWMARRNGAVEMDELARLSGYESRHLRRMFLRDAGVTPKRLARILRFRRASQLAATGLDWAAVAAECGYYDQAHLSRDFRELAGIAPEAWRMSVFSNTQEETAPYHREHEDHSDTLRGCD